MQWIVITPPLFVEGEANVIDLLFRHGVDLLHFRKPDSTVEACRRLLQEIPAQWYGRIVLHDHFELALELGLHGVHLNRRNPKAPVAFQGSISCSCHSLEEVVSSKPQCNYVFLSPIYDSISKEGYGSSFSDSQLRNAASKHIIDKQVIALGGISLERLSEIRSYHFGGAAFLGAIWSRKDSPCFAEYLDHIHETMMYD